MANVNIGTTRDFTPNDTTVDAFTLMMVTGSTGAVSYSQGGGNTVILTAVPVGQWIPVGNAVRINATGTTAAGFMVV